VFYREDAADAIACILIRYSGMVALLGHAQRNKLQSVQGSDKIMCRREICESGHDFVMNMLLKSVPS
jgi:hypothetical protein